MDIRYKSFVPRSKQDHNFDQIIRNTTNYNQTSYGSKYSNFSEKSSKFPDRSPPGLSSNRKRVNVVTFTPDESNELVAKSIVVSNSDNSSNNSPTYDISKSVTPNLPSILRSTQHYELTPEKDATVHTASKLMAAKRKAAKEVQKSDDTKKKVTALYSIDSFPKRAVSPEILNPEPSERKPLDYNLKYSSNLSTDILKKNKIEKVQNLNTNLTTGIRTERHQFEQPKMKNITSNQESMNQGRPIINLKKSKLTYNPRPWQSSLDDEDEDDFKLKAKNIVYGEDFNETNIRDPGDSKDTFSSDNASKEVSDKLHLNGQNKEKICDVKYKKTKAIYPAVENLKEAYECQETGETQDLMNDVEYLVEGLKGSIKPSTKTLSIISLTRKCLSKSFRDMLKAHGLLYKILHYLSDADKDDSLAICTAALFLVFSRDKQPRTFHEESLSMLMKLSHINKNQLRFNKDYERTRDRLRLILDKLHNNLQNTNSTVSTFQRRCYCCRHIKLDNNITTEDLVVECLLQLATRKTVDWFKDQMRRLRGIDLICEQVSACVEYLGSDLGPQCLDEFVLDRLYRLFNYMRFLEHMTFQNRDNQSYLIDYNDGSLIMNLCRCLKLCAANLSYQSSGTLEKKLIQACLMAILRLLANISHDNEWASNQLGCCNGLLKLIFSCLLHLPRFMCGGKRFDLSVLALALLINLVEHCSENRLRMAHVAVSRKRVACLGRMGQFQQSENGEDTGTSAFPKVSVTENGMEFAFSDEPDEEDMDLDDDDEVDEDEFQTTQVIDFDNADSSEKRINVLEALVKLFLRHDDRAQNNTIIEGEGLSENTGITESNSAESRVSCSGSNKGEPDTKWRIIQQPNKIGSVPGINRPRRRSLRQSNEHKSGIMSDSDDDDEVGPDDEEELSSGEEGADVEFLINSKEEEAELQKKLSAAGQHMQDSVVSAYTALLLGCIIKGSTRFMERIREHLPEGKFKLMAFVLAKLLSILSITSGMGQSSEESILEIVRLLEAQDNVKSSEDLVQPSITRVSSQVGETENKSYSDLNSSKDSISYSRYYRENNFDDEFNDDYNENDKLGRSNYEFDDDESGGATSKIN